MMPHNTPRIGHVNTPCIDVMVIESEMAFPVAERLRDARRRAGYETAAAAAEAFGWKVSGYRHHENGTRPFDVDAARRYAYAFRVDPAWLLGLATTQAPPHIPQENEVDVIGSVAAGVWREETEWEPDRRYTIAVSPSPFPGSRRFGLKVEGLSMDLQFPPGTILDCVEIFGLGLEPANDDHVIVERRRADGQRELTVKKFQIDEAGRKWLVPESTQPEFQAPIEIDGAGEEDEVRVVAYVIGSYQPRSLRLLQRSRMIAEGGE